MNYSWARSLMLESLAKQKELASVFAVTIHGVQHIGRADHIARAADKFDQAVSKLPGQPPYDPEFNRLEIEHADSISTWARAEKERGFRTLVANYCVASWAALEAFIEDLIVACLEHDPSLMEQEDFARLKIPLAEFLSLSDEERRRFLVGEVARRNGSRLGVGIGPFETLLDIVGLGGGTPDECKRTLLEISEVRNCLVHRGGKADRRLVKVCPWLGLKVDDPIPLNESDSHRFTAAVLEYSMNLAQRAGLVKQQV